MESISWEVCEWRRSNGSLRLGRDSVMTWVRASSLKLWKQPRWQRPLGCRKGGGVMILRNCDQKFRYRPGSSANINQSPGLLLCVNGCTSCVLLAYPRDYISKLYKRHKPDGNCSFQSNLLIHMLTSFIDHLHLCLSMKGSLNRVKQLLIEHVPHSLTWQSSHRWLTCGICS